MESPLLAGTGTQYQYLADYTGTLSAGAMGNLLHTMGNMTLNSSQASPFSMIDNLLFTAGHSSPLLQLFLVVYKLTGSRLSLDASMILTLLGFLWGLWKLMTQVYSTIMMYVGQYLMCSMCVKDDDQIYLQLLNFLSLQQNVANSRSLRAETVWKSAWEEEDDLEGSLLLTDGGESDGEEQYLNFSNMSARSSPRYTPDVGLSSFKHNGSRFYVHRVSKSSIISNPMQPIRNEETLRISRYSRSIEPIKGLLAKVKDLYYDDDRKQTTIYRPRTRERISEWNMWQRVSMRPVRPMSTVVLDSSKKREVMRDINQYLHPSTPNWYASRGIPLRRGYLFHGPPGTGKTSFSFALAGVFGIDIYVISLQDPAVGEEELALLFTKLPRRCIVLLEDIDTAGLRQTEVKETSEEVKTKKEESELHVTKKTKRCKNKKKNESSSSSVSDSESSSLEDDGMIDRRKLARKSRHSKPGKKNAAAQTISLSGLLNAIDGVASHEGRILIMTTNKPESLDEALIRPGRIDMQVAFDNATAFQATELFHRMYEASEKATADSTKNIETKQQKLEDGSTATMENSKLRMVLREKSEPEIEEVELKRIAEEFGKLIPDLEFSPAEIQGFLLKRKKSPQKALEDAPAWIEAAVKQKETKSKVVMVQ